jgi:hypothetical protein
MEAGMAVEAETWNSLLKAASGLVVCALKLSLLDSLRSCAAQNHP